MIKCGTRGPAASVTRVVRPAVQIALRAGLATGLATVMSLSSLAPAQAEQVRVVETSLGLADNTRLLRHLGLRIGDDSNFVECHFGPGEGGELRDGFLKTGKGKVADSKYLDVLDAGETSLSKEEVMEWCREWAKDRVFLTVGQNCWTMVYDFLSTHEGCEISDDLRLREQRVNSATKALLNAAENLAVEEGRTTEEVMNDVMEDPKRLFPLLFTAENMKGFVDLDLQPIAQKGQAIANVIPEPIKKLVPGPLTANEAAGQVEDAADDLNAEADRKKDDRKS